MTWQAVIARLTAEVGDACGRGKVTADISVAWPLPTIFFARRDSSLGYQNVALGHENKPKLPSLVGKRALTANDLKPAQSFTSTFQCDHGLRRPSLIPGTYRDLPTDEAACALGLKSDRRDPIDLRFICGRTYIT